MRPIRERDLVALDIEGVPARVLQTGLGCASALVLVPDELRRIFGPAAAAASWRPCGTCWSRCPRTWTAQFAAWLNEEFATMDPNGLALDAFLVDGEACATRAPRPRPGVALGG